MVRLNGRAYSEEDVESVDAAGEGADFSESGESGEEEIDVLCTSLAAVRGAVVCLAVQLCIPSGLVTDGSRRDSLTVRTVRRGDSTARKDGFRQQAATVDGTVL